MGKQGTRVPKVRHKVRGKVLKCPTFAHQFQLMSCDNLPQNRRPVGPPCRAVSVPGAGAGTGIATNGRGCCSFLKGFIRATDTCMILSRCFKAWRRFFHLEVGVSMSARSWVQDLVCFVSSKFLFMTRGCNHQSHNCVHTEWSPRFSTSECVGSPPGPIAPVQGFCTTIAVRPCRRGEGGCSPRGKASVTIV